jgi:hypothetical protein
MSGIDYSNPSVNKNDLKKLESYAASLGGGGGGVPDPLAVNSLSANDGQITTFQATNATITSGLSAATLSGGSLTVSGTNITFTNVPNAAATTKVLYINPSTNVVTRGDVPTASVPDPLVVDNLTVNLQSDLYGDLNLHGIASGTTTNILYYDPSSKIVTYDSAPTSSSTIKYFFNRKTSLTSIVTTSNVAKVLDFLTGSSPTDYEETVSSSAFSLDGTTLGSHAIVYNSVGTTIKKFYIQTSFAFFTGGSGGNFAYELRINGIPITHARFPTVTANLGMDCQDYNVVTLNPGDRIGWAVVANTVTCSLSTTGAIGFTSTARPMQIFINEV